MFERFTERARQVVVLAQDEARGLRHNSIGTEHLLLGLLREEEGIAARVLESFSMSVEEVRGQVARIVGPGDASESGQMIPFMPGATKALETSLREAFALGHNQIGTEHLLLAVLRENQGVATRILTESGVDPDRVREEVLRHLSGARLPTRTAHPPVPIHSRNAVEDVEPWAWLYDSGTVMLAGAVIFGGGIFLGWLIWG